MKSVTKIIATALVLCLPLYAAAQDEIVGASSKSRKALELYSQAGGTEPVREISVNEIGWPLPVKEKKSGYLAVQIKGEDYWVRNIHVRVKKGSTADCVAMAVRSELTNSMPGIGSGSCK